jgi:hypothetical protein
MGDRKLKELSTTICSSHKILFLVLCTASGLYGERYDVSFSALQYDL